MVTTLPTVTVPLITATVQALTGLLNVSVAVAVALVVVLYVVGLVDLELSVMTVPAEVALAPIACKLVSAFIAAAKFVAIVVSVSPAKTV
jgi:hypothetical protein